MMWLCLNLIIFCVLSLNGEIEAKKPKSQDDRLTITPKIVNGMDSADGQAPYQGSLQIKQKHSCGCAIINAYWLLTAAHCVDRNTINEMEILVGTNKLSSGGQRYKVKRAIQHDGFMFGDRSKANDIAVIYVDGPIKFNDRVQPIKYSTQEVDGNENLLVTGWGTLDYPGDQPDNLQMLNVTSITNKLCERKTFQSVHKSILCTYNPGKGTCVGDSGGPLVNPENGQLVGIVNWSLRGCASGHPDGYARISYHHSWIEKKMGLQ